MHGRPLILQTHVRRSCQSGMAHCRRNWNISRRVIWNSTVYVRLLDLPGQQTFSTEFVMRDSLFVHVLLAV